MILKKLFAVLTLATAAISAIAEGTIFNVATYNIRQQNKSDEDAGNGWDRRWPVVADVIRFHDFDIFGTQEGFKNQLDSLDKALPQHKYIGSGRDDGKEGGEHSAIFYRTDMFDLVDHGDFWLSETPDRPGLGWDAACVRICTWGHFRHKTSGKEFLMFNLHMDHVGTKARSESAKLIKKKILELGSELPTFLSGDFNVDQNSDSYRTVLQCGLLNSHDVSEFVYQHNGTFNAYHTNAYTDERIDHIFVSPSVKVKKYGVLTDTYRTPKDGDKKLKATDFPAGLTIKEYESRNPSDHFPVRIMVEL